MRHTDIGVLNMHNKLKKQCIVIISITAIFLIVAVLIYYFAIYNVSNLITDSGGSSEVESLSNSSMNDEGVILCLHTHLEI